MATSHNSVVQSDDDSELNKRKHLISLSFTKTADALIDPKLVLSWLITALGAPAYLAGTVVPIREAGALLPQPLVARWASEYALRKPFWAFGAAVQGVAALAIAVIALTLEGAMAGWLILLSLTLFACGRAVASTTYKDALARTVAEGERGSVTGWAGTIAAATGLAFGASLAFGLWGDVTVPVIAGAIGVAVLLFATAALVFLRLSEAPQEDQSVARNSFAAFIAPLREDANFRRFVIVRALLTVTALAPPFIVLTSNSAETSSLTTLGPLVIASGLAAILSSALWGQQSDRSSRISLALGGAVAAVAYAVAVVTIILGGGVLAVTTAAALLFVAQVGYQGVRSGRSIYLTDMASDEDRLRYTALSNILIGVVLVFGLSLGGVASLYGGAGALAICALLSTVGAILALRLKEVSA